MIQLLKNISAAVASVGKVILLSRRPFKRGSAAGRELIILGNGPALRKVIDEQLPLLQSSLSMAVNFAANAPEFSMIKPAYYVLADGHFFSGVSTDENVARLWKNLSATSWSMTLFVPHKYLKRAGALLESDNVNLAPYNLTPAEGTPAITHLLFNHGLAMPRPRNVLIPSIMIGIRLGFKKIILCGADHTWTRTLGVDEQNHVISVQPHFYKDSAREQTRVNTEYSGLCLHNILQSLYIAFRAYHEIKAYADRRGVEILNATPGSMIDAFPRICL